MIFKFDLATIEFAGPGARLDKAWVEGNPKHFSMEKNGQDAGTTRRVRARFVRLPSC